MRNTDFGNFSIKLTLALLAVAFLTVGCAHPIIISPALSSVTNDAGESKKIDASVGYYISASSTNLEVTTPGGGGDSVRYYPYRDIESGYQRVLASVFRTVSKISSPASQSPGNDKLDYVIEPVIITNSGSTGHFTWPPTNFSVDLSNNIRDASGQLVATSRVVGIGTAETSERLSEYGIAGRRAMEDALIKMRASLLESALSQKSTRTTPIAPITASTSDMENRLARLLELKNKGLISAQEYEEKRKAILDAL